MRFYALIIGFVSGWATGKTVDFFLNYPTYNGILGGIFTGLFVFIFFKHSNVSGTSSSGIGVSDDITRSPQAKALIENTYLFWISNLIVAVALSAVGKIGYFFAGFIVCGLSPIIGTVSIACGAGVLALFTNKYSANSDAHKNSPNANKSNPSSDTKKDKPISNSDLLNGTNWSIMDNDSDKLIIQLCGFEPHFALPQYKSSASLMVKHLLKRRFDTNYSTADLALHKLCFYAGLCTKEGKNNDVKKIRAGINTIYFTFEDTIRPDLKLSDDLHQYLDYGYTDDEDDEDDRISTLKNNGITKIKVIGLLASLVEHCIQDRPYDEFAAGYICLGRGFHVGHLQFKPVNNDDNLCCVSVEEVLKGCEAMEVARHIKDPLLLTPIVDNFCLAMSKHFEEASDEYRQLESV